MPFTRLILVVISALLFAGCQLVPPPYSETVDGKFSIAEDLDQFDPLLFGEESNCRTRLASIHRELTSESTDAEVNVLDDQPFVFGLFRPDDNFCVILQGTTMYGDDEPLRGLRQALLAEDIRFVTDPDLPFITVEQPPEAKKPDWLKWPGWLKRKPTAAAVPAAS